MNWRQIFEEVDENGEDLTEWEIDFVEDIAKSMDDPEWEPTEGQIRKLREIRRERC